MQFGPAKAPCFYSDTMKKFMDKWDMLFIENLRQIGTIIKKEVTVMEIYEVFIGDKKIISVSRTIIDVILLF